VQYGHIMGTASKKSLIVASPGNWLWAGTGVVAGQAIPGLLNYEIDRAHSSPLPPGARTLVADSPITTHKGAPGKHNASVYRAPSGAWVFAAGTMGWPWGLDNLGGKPVHAAIQRATKNVLARLLL